jgi:IclR family pca regulon transcriptional regulator
LHLRSVATVDRIPPDKDAAPQAHVASNPLLRDFEDDRSFVMSFARGLAVIRSFVGATRARSTADVSARTGISRASARRLLHTMGELGYATVEGSRYMLTSKALELGYAFSSSCDLAVELSPSIGKLAATLQTFCAVNVLDDDEVRVLCSSGSPHHHMPRTLTGGVGAKLPLYASASGLLFLAEFSPVKLKEYLARVPMRPLTSHTPSEARLPDSLAKVRAQRYAICDRGFSEALRSIAVPVWGPMDNIVAAVVAVISADKLNVRALRQTVLPELQWVADQARRKWQ